MPHGDGTGPVGQGSKDGRGKRFGGKGQTSKQKGSGPKTGGKKGSCK